MTEQAQSKKKVKFCPETLEAIRMLMEGTEGAYECVIHAATDFKPRGRKQDCDLGIVPHEWVDQIENGGFTGDSFSGTVTWDLGSHFLVASYAI